VLKYSLIVKTVSKRVYLFQGKTMALKTELNTTTPESLIVLQITQEIWDCKESLSNDQLQNDQLLETKRKIEEWKKCLDTLSTQVFDDAYVLVVSLYDLQKTVELDVNRHVKWEIEWLKNGMRISQENDRFSKDRKKALLERVEHLQKEETINQSTKIALKHLVGVFGNYTIYEK
jgi:hypothetical protein